MGKGYAFSQSLGFFCPFLLLILLCMINFPLFIVSSFSLTVMLGDLDLDATICCKFCSCTEKKTK